MKTNEELFDFLEELVEELGTSKQENARATALRIQAAAGISSVGTEILMALRRELTNLSQSRIEVKESTARKLRAAISGINEELAR